MPLYYPPSYMTATTTASALVQPLFYVDISATGSLQWVTSGGTASNTVQWVDREYARNYYDPVQGGPAIRRSEQDLLVRDQAAFERAVLEHDTQEAERYGRIIGERQRTIQNARSEQDARQLLAEQERLRQQAAIDRAHDLLMENLRPDQRDTVERNGWFVVEGGRSGTRYRVNATRGYQGNIDVLTPEGQTVYRLCCHIPSHRGLPHADQILAQKIMLELAEDDFLRLANRQ